MRSLLSVLFILSVSIPSYTQTILEGTVLNKTKEPIEGAIVSVIKQKDSSILKLSVTKKDGSFKITLLEQEPLLLKITSLGYHPYFTKNITGQSNFILDSTTNNLTSVVVKSTIPLYRFLPDKTIVNIDAIPSNAGNNLFEVLSKLPDVLIDQSGNITMNGKPDVLVLIDGKETFLNSTSLLNLLKSTPASSSNQIEVITNPSAKYEATASGGVLNIKTKKGQQQGLNGTIALSTGVVTYNDIDDKNKVSAIQNSSLNWNYRKKNLNIYGNISTDNGFSFENFKTNRWFYNSATKNPEGSYFSWSHIKSPSQNYQFKIATDIELSKKQLLGFIVNISNLSSTAIGATNSYVRNKADLIEYLMESSIASPQGTDKTGNYNINHKLTTNKIELSSDISYLTFASNSLTNNQTRFFDTLNTDVLPNLYRRQFASTNFNGIVLKSDIIIHNLMNIKWEAGYKYSFIETISNPLFLRKSSNDFIIDGGRTNYFKYSDKIHALYLIGSKNLTKTTIQFGVRIETTEGNGYQQINDSSFKRSWINLFPSFYLKRDISKNYQLILNYSRKIKRPSAGNLNPFTYFTDSLYSNYGNPFLQPQFSHTVELRNIIKNKYAFTLSYSVINNWIAVVVFQEPVFKTTGVSRQNFNQYSSLNASANIPIRMTSYWQLNFSPSLGINKATGVLFGERIRESGAYYNINALNNFTLPKSWSADVSINYVSPQLLGLVVMSRPLIYNIGIKKELKNNRGSIGLSSTLPLSIPHYRFYANYATTEYASRFSTGGQNYRLVISLKIGKQTVSQQRQKKNATEEEQSRM